MFLFDSVSCEYMFKMRDGDNSRLVMCESYCEADQHDRDPKHVMIKDHTIEAMCTLKFPYQLTSDGRN